jgi:hypothetical protein
LNLVSAPRIASESSASAVLAILLSNS